MSESETGEVTSSTDIQTQSENLVNNELTGAINISASTEPLVDSTITEDDESPPGEDEDDDLDPISFSSGQEVVAMPTGLDTLAVSAGEDGNYAIVNADQALCGQAGQLILTADGSALTGQGISLAGTSALQGIFANPGSTQHLTTASGETIQIITLANPEQLAAMGNNKIWQLMPTMGSSDNDTIVINQPDPHNIGMVENIGQSVMATSNTATQVVDMVPVSSLPGSIAEMLMAPPQHIHTLPPGCPQWAARLKDCERIGDAYRGWVESEVELDLLLTYHKQHTQSFWGTRQSPSPAKQSTRLMWKSQYVPFDGIPFVNAGSRAIVMECQFGPRRKGAQVKRLVTETVARLPKASDFRQTCPARIYIKKVRKFTDCAVDINQDKKTIKITMDRAFQILKERGLDGHGQERYYVQLPTESAHEFHRDMAEVVVEDSPSRLHPRVSEKVREMVACGESRLYAVRKALRRFVERELFDSPESVPERHNLTFYPTVNDLQNHIHQALRDITSGILQPIQPSYVEDLEADRDELGWESKILGSGPSPHAETVTVTLTQHPAEDGQHVISRVETHLSDGSTKISNSLTPETAQLLAKLHPNMFPSGSVLQVLGSEPDLSSLKEDESSRAGALSQVNAQTINLVNSSNAMPSLRKKPFIKPKPTITVQTVPTTSLLAPDPSISIASDHVTGLEMSHDEGELGEEEDSGGLHNIQIMDPQTGMIIHPDGSGLPPGLQFISADSGELTDSQGRPLHILSSIDGQGISFIRDPTEHMDSDVTTDIDDVTSGVNEAGAITITMNPDDPVLMKEEDMEVAMVTEPLD